MKDLKRIVAAGLSTAFLITGCSYPAQETLDNVAPPKVITEHPAITDRAVVDLKSIDPQNADASTGDAYLEFAIGLYAREASRTDENLMISPASVLLALSMTAAGTAGDTLTQMTDVLAPGETPEALQAFAVDYNGRINEGSGIELHSANSIWLNGQYAEGVYQDYLDYITDDYCAKVGVISMDSAGEAEINGWVNDRTNGMIPSVIQPGSLQSSDYAILVNAIAFDAVWSGGPLDVIGGQPFNNANGSVSNVDFMSAEPHDLLSTDLATGCKIYYEGAQYAFIVMLPTDETIDANTFASQLTAQEYLDFWYSSSYQEEMYLLCPEFSCDFSTSLKSDLIDMGMTAPFSVDEADFANMTDAQISIGEVIQVTHIDVDHNGTRASAATAVEATAAGVVEEPIYITLDRPFVYAIVDTQTGLPLFIGTVNNFS